MNRSYPIEKYMSRSPHTIGEDIPLSKAIGMMRELHLRHLPVLNAGRLVGVLSDRDVKLATSANAGAKELRVGDIMTEPCYSVGVHCPLSLVVQEMAEHKYGCAVVLDEQGMAVGVFTAIDALGLLAEWLRKKTFAEPEPEPEQRRARR